MSGEKLGDEGGVIHFSVVPDNGRYAVTVIAASRQPVLVILKAKEPELHGSLAHANPSVWADYRDDGTFAVSGMGGDLNAVVRAMIERVESHHGRHGGDL